MGSIQDRLDTVVTTNDVKTKLIADMKETVRIGSRVTRSIVLLDDVNLMAREKVKLINARKEYDKAMSALEKYTPNATIQAIRDRMNKARDNVRNINDQILRLAAVKEDSTATVKILSESGPATTEWLNALEENEQLQTATNNALYASALSAYRFSKNLMIAIGVMTVLFSLGIAYLLSRSIVDPLNKATQIAKAISNGSLDSIITTQHNDEVS